MDMKHLLFLILLISPLHLFSQQEHSPQADKKLNKNSIHASIGTVILYSTINCYYDRVIFERHKNKTTVGLFRLGYGRFGGIENEGEQYILQSGIFRSYFEGLLGFAIRPQDGDELLKPAISIGVRWQEPNKSFLFRTGIAYPESIYFGLGFSF
jgi:hypothetical protein